MKRNYYVLELQDMGSLYEIESACLKFPDYALKKIDGKKYITPIGNPEINPIEHKEFGNYEILISLLNTIKKPFPIKEGFMGEHMEEVIPIDVLINWFYLYGLPYEEYYLVNGEKHLGINIEKFRYKIAFMAEHFYLWQALQGENEKEIDRQIALMGYNPRKYTNETEKAVKAKEILAQILRCLMSGYTLLPHYDKNTDSFGLKVTAFNLMQVCYYQLAALITKKEDGRNLKTCKACGQFFWANHGNIRFCVNCDRRTYWSRKNRQKNKTNK